ncbi:MAG: hypothetical protein ACE5GB_03120 [Acidimicrobiales bacterium]
MNHRLDLLRLAVGLVHSVPGAELCLTMNDGTRRRVGTHPSADIDPCAMRRVLLAGACSTRPDPSRWIRQVHLQGSVRHEGAGIYRDLSATARWWTATLLGPGEVSGHLTALRAIELPDVELPDIEVSAAIKPDDGLGVTIVALSAPRARHDSVVRELTMAATSLFLVNEVFACFRSGAAYSRRATPRPTDSGGPR